MFRFISVAAAMSPVQIQKETCPQYLPHGIELRDRPRKYAMYQWVECHGIELNGIFGCRWGKLLEYNETANRWMDFDEDRCPEVAIDPSGPIEELPTWQLKKACSDPCGEELDYDQYVCSKPDADCADSEKPMFSSPTPTRCKRPQCVQPQIEPSNKFICGGFANAWTTPVANTKGRVTVNCAYTNRRGEERGALKNMTFRCRYGDLQVQAGKKAGYKWHKVFKYQMDKWCPMPEVMHLRQ